MKREEFELERDRFSKTKEIERLKFMEKEIKNKGIDALHDIDKPRGVEWALQSIKSQIEGLG